MIQKSQILQFLKAWKIEKHANNFLNFNSLFMLIINWEDLKMPRAQFSSL